MPLGASFLKWWCRSTISMSAESPSARAASPTSFIRRLTARLVLGEISSAIRSACFARVAFCSGSNPVVQTARGIPALAQASAIARLAVGIEKSITTLTGFVSPASSGTPSGPRPISVPTSEPSPG